MSLMRSVLLAASQNHWLRDHASHYRFVRRSVSRFMSGETLDDAPVAAQTLRRKRIGTVFTQLGLDLSLDICFDHLKMIIARAPRESIVWIDMEASNYVDVTLDLYRRALGESPNVGICLQAYLYRTK